MKAIKSLIIPSITRSTANPGCVIRLVGSNIIQLDVDIGIIGPIIGIGWSQLE